MNLNLRERRLQIVRFGVLLLERGKQSLVLCSERVELGVEIAQSLSRGTFDRLDIFR